MSNAVNLNHVRTVRNHVRFLLSGLPQMEHPISYPELSTALRQLADEYDELDAQQYQPVFFSDRS